MANGDQKIWNMANIIITAMAAIIAALVSVGFYSISSKIEIGDSAIYARLIERDSVIYTRLTEIKIDVKGLSETLTKMHNDITRIDTLQKIRIERENRDEGRRNAK